jgi:hypothetical protein
MVKNTVSILRYINGIDFIPLDDHNFHRDCFTLSSFSHFHLFCKMVIFHPILPADATIDPLVCVGLTRVHLFR